MLIPNIEIVAHNYDYVLAYDVDLLSRIIYLEAGSQGHECMEAVGSVILNRVESNLFPDNLHDVIYQKNQYSTAKVSCNDIPDEARKIAYHLLDEGSILPEYVLYQHYKRPVKGTKVYKRINKEVFSY